MGILRRTQRLQRGLLYAALVAFSLLLPKKAWATFDLTLTALGGGQTHNLTWSAAVDPASTTAKVTYRIYREYGRITPNVSIATQVATAFDATALSVSTSAGTVCYRLTAATSVSGVFDASDTECHNYLHFPGAANESIARTDGNGGQLGFNQQWKFEYFLDADSLVRFYVYPPGTTFQTDSFGFSEPISDSTPTAILADLAPRSGELTSASVSNTEIWNSRNSTGSTVANGLYFLHFKIVNPLLSPSVRHQGVTTIPVDIIRFTAFSTTGISDSVALANINYTITGDAAVRIVIAKPGRTFTVTGDGLVQALDENSNIDTSSHSVVKVITFNRKAGTYSETWNGTDSNGTAVSSGIYSVGVSAIDGYGNQALNINGNDGPLTGTITVDKQASETASDTTAPTILGIKVGNSTITLSGVSELTSGFSSIVVNINETAGTSSNESTITLADPDSTNVTGTVSTLGSSVTFTPSSAQSSTGTYTLIVTARDSQGNATSPTTFNFSLDPTPPSVSAITVVGESVGLSGGTEIAVAFSSVVIRLNELAGTGVNVSTITMTDPASANISSNAISISGSSLTFAAQSLQTATGTYTLTVTARDALGNVTGPANYTFSLDPTPPTVQTIHVAGTQVSLDGSSSIAVRFSSVVVKISEVAGTGVNIGTITLTDPAGAAVTGALLTSGDTLTFTAQALQIASGTYTLGITATDRLNNTSGNANFTFIADDIDPVINQIKVAGNLISLAGGTQFSGSFSSAVFKLDEPAGTGSFESSVSLVGPNGASISGVVSTFQSSVTFTASQTQTATGTYRLTATVRDLLGNETGPASHNFVLDGAAPAVVGISVAGNQVDLGGGSQFRLFFSSAVVLLDEASGNGARLSTVTITNPSGASISGTVSISGSSLTFTAGSLQTSSGTYSIFVTPEDAYGNAALTSTYTFLADGLVPIVSSITVSGQGIALGGGTELSISFSSATVQLDEPAGTGANESSIVLFDPNGTSVAGVVSTFGSSVTFTAQNAQTAKGVYTLAVAARDAIGNQTATVNYTFSIDPTGPGVSSILAAGNLVNLGGGSEIAVKFSSVVVILDEKAGTGVNTSTITMTDPTGTNIAGTLQTIISSLTFTAGVLQTSTGTYTITVNGVDSLGNAAAAAVYTFSIDPTPPLVQEIRVAVTTISLSGGTEVSAAFTNILVRLDETAGTGAFESQVALTGPNGAVSGVVANFGSSVTFTASSAQQSTGSYTLTVTARDAFGNAAPAKDYSFLLDATAPAVTAIRVAGNEIALGGGTQLGVSFSSIVVLLDEAAGTGALVSTVTVAHSTGGAVAGSLSTSGGSLTFTAASLQSSTGTYTMTVTARDALGNASGATPFTFFIDPAPPIVEAVTVGASTISLSGGTQLSAGFTTLVVRLDENSGAGSLLTLTGPNGSAITGVTTVFGTSVTFNATSVQSSTGSYILSVSAVDALGNAAASTAYEFTIDATAPAVAKILVADSAIDLGGSSRLQILFSTVVVLLDEASGTGANVSTVTLTNPLGGAATGFLSISGSSLTFTTEFLQSGSGDYTVTVTARDGFGNTGSATPYSFFADGIAPTVSSVTVGGTLIDQGGGTQFSNAFSSVVFLLDEPAGTGANEGVIQLFDPNGSLVTGVTSTFGSSVTFTSTVLQVTRGTYTVTLIPRDTVGNTTAKKTYTMVLDDIGPSVNGITVAGNGIDLGGSSQLTVSFSSVVVTLSETAGTGVAVSTITMTDVAGAAISGSLASSGNTITFSANATQASSGTYSVFVTPSDQYGNGSPVSTYTFFIDPTAPVVEAVTVGASTISLSGGTQVLTQFTNIVIRLDESAGMGANESSVSLTGPSGAVSGLTSTFGSSVTFSAASAQTSTGAYTLSVTARDAFGNAASATSYGFVLDATGPAITDIIVAGNRIDLGGASKLQVWFSSVVVLLDEASGTGFNVSTVTITDPAGAAISGSLSISGSSLTFTTQFLQASSGTYTVTVTARDALGNAGAATPFTFTADAIPPVVSSITVAGQGIALMGTSALSVAFSTIVVRLDEPAGSGVNESALTLKDPSGAVVLGIVSTFGSSVTFTASSIQSASGTYILTVTARDAIGNLTGPTDYSFSIGDPSAPTVLSIKVAGQSTNLGGSSELKVFFSSVVVKLSEAGGTGVFTSTVTISNPLGGNVTGQVTTSGDEVTFTAQLLQTLTGTYTVFVTPRDSSGNSNLTSTHTFIADPVGPAVSAITVAGSSVTLSGGSKFAIAFSSVVVFLDEAAGTGSNESLLSLTDPKGAAVTGVISTFGSSVTFTTFALQTASGSYTLTVTARDALGNTATTVSHTFIIDASGPTVQSIAVGGSGIDLGGGTTITGSFTSLIVLLDEASGTGATISTVTLTDPNSTAVAGTLSISGSSLTFTPAASQSTAGSYTLTVSAEDPLGNATAPTVYTFLLAAGSSSGGSTMTQEEFEASVIPYPNPIRRAPLQVEFVLDANATVDFEIFTILGERLFHQSQAYSAGTQTFNWALLNNAARTIGNGVYLFRITATMPNRTHKVTKKVMVVQ